MTQAKEIYVQLSSRAPDGFRLAVHPEHPAEIWLHSVATYGPAWCFDVEGARHVVELLREGIALVEAGETNREMRKPDGEEHVTEPTRRAALLE
jgi:hypothetical protein